MRSISFQEQYLKNTPNCKKHSILRTVFKKHINSYTKRRKHPTKKDNQL